jgi:hypothetical protein
VFDAVGMGELADGFERALLALTDHCLQAPLATRLSLCDVSEGARAGLMDRALRRSSGPLPGLRRLWR